MSLFWLIRVTFNIFVWSQLLLFMEHLHTVFTQTNNECVCEATGVSCPTWLSQHVGKADVWAQAWVHFHPGWHGVKLAMIMELIQKFLCEQKNVMQDRNEENKQSWSKWFFSNCTHLSLSAHLETFSVFALASSLPQKSLLLVLLLLLLQSPDVLLKTNEGIFFVHIYNHTTQRRRQ